MNLIPAISNISQEISQREVENEQSQPIEMETFHTNSRIINVQPIQQSQISNENENYENRNENGNENTISVQLSNSPSHGTSIPTIEQNNPPGLQINNCKYNKNLISFTGVFVFVTILYLFIIITYMSNHMSADATAFYLYVCFCLVSIGLPTIYFVYHPRHLINVLKGLHFLS